MKYVGLFLIFVSCTAGGMMLAGGVTRSLSLCEAMLAFIRHIRGKVSYYKSPVGDICSSFQNEVFRRFGIDRLIIEQGFSRALELERGALSMEEDAYGALRDFATRLGSLSYDEQIADCDYVAETLEAAIAQKREAISSKRQIYSMMGMLSGAMAVLVLI